MGKPQKLESLWIDLRRLELIWVNPRTWEFSGYSKKLETLRLDLKNAGTSLGEFQELEILLFDLKRLELLWANPRSWKFYGQISKG